MLLYSISSDKLDLLRAILEKAHVYTSAIAQSVQHCTHSHELRPGSDAAVA